MLTQRRMNIIEQELEDMRLDIRAHIAKLDEEDSIYNISSIRQLHKLLDNINEALESIEEMKS